MLTSPGSLQSSPASTALAYVNASGLACATAAIAVALGVAWVAQLLPPWLTLALTAGVRAARDPLNVPALRRKLVSDGMLAVFRKVLPPMSQTEREAIEAGTVWWDGELFSGRRTGASCVDARYPTLTPEEQHFLDHEVEELCEMVTDWETTHIYRDLPPRCGSSSRTAASSG